MNELCLAMAIYFEARNQLAIGQMAVAQVIMNRVESKRWPNTICGVVKAKHAFTFYWDGKPETIYELDSYAMARGVARMAIADELPDLVGKANHYHTTKVQPSWSHNMQFVRIIGDHIFWQDIKLKERL